MNKLLLPHYLYSNAKHIPLFSQRPFHFHCSIGALFILTRQTQYYVEADVVAMETQLIFERFSGLKFGAEVVNIDVEVGELDVDIKVWINNSYVFKIYFWDQTLFRIPVIFSDYKISK